MSDFILYTWSIVALLLCIVGATLIFSNTRFTLLTWIPSGIAGAIAFVCGLGIGTSSIANKEVIPINFTYLKGNQVVLVETEEMGYFTYDDIKTYNTIDKIEQGYITNEYNHYGVVTNTYFSLTK